MSRTTGCDRSADLRTYSARRSPPRAKASSGPWVECARAATCVPRPTMATRADPTIRVIRCAISNRSGLLFSFLFSRTGPGGNEEAPSSFRGIQTPTSEQSSRDHGAGAGWGWFGRAWGAGEGRQWLLMVVARRGGMGESSHRRLLRRVPYFENERPTTEAQRPERCQGGSGPGAESEATEAAPRALRRGVRPRDS